MATQHQAVGAPHGRPALNIRRATPADAEICGNICYEAFHDISTRHNFPPDFPSAEIAVGLLSMMFSHPGFYCVVAEQEGRIIGSNVLDERNPISGVGPITVDPAAQNRTAGRQLMIAVMNRSAERNFPGIRLLQAGFHMRSLSVYAKLGFVVREPLACMQGPAIREILPGTKVRPAQLDDLADCNALCMRVHGHDRAGELRDAIAQGTAVVAELAGRITGYASSIAFFGHAVAETNVGLKALIAAAKSFGGPGFMLPMRNANLFHWCLANGLRVVQSMTLMSMGLYNEPAGAYLPSIAY